jgi:hypothetical protein
MRRLVLCAIVLGSAHGLVGCGSTPEPTGEVFHPAASLLGDSIQISLAQLLQKPRAELAEMCTEWLTKINLQSKSRSEGQLHFVLLPKLHLPLVLPVCHEMSFSASQGISFPPYAHENDRDPGLAVLLARYGDLEAARRFVGAEDGVTLRQVETSVYERSYPVEWTRLVALLFHEAQLRLATGDIQGGTELVVLHKQLREVLDPKAARGPLGAVLLGLGHETLKQASAAWKADRKLEIASQTEQILKEWADIPERLTAVPLGASRGEITALVGGTAQKRVLPASQVLRWMDLFDLPFPADGARAAWACFDHGDKLQDVYVCYQPSVRELLPGPGDLARCMDARPEPSNEGRREPGLLRRIYQLGTVSCTVTTIDHGAGMAAYVRLGKEMQSPEAVGLTRDFGALHLDRSFEQNRLHLIPEERGETLVVTQAQRLAAVLNPLPALKLGQATLEQESGQDLVRRISLVYPCGEHALPAHWLFSLPLWAAFGSPTIVGEEDPHGGHLAFTWRDPLTLCSLWLPYEEGQPIRFEVTDNQGPQAFALRAAKAASQDESERTGRLQAGKPLQNIRRHLEQFDLGMSRTQALSFLPTGAAVLKQDIANGISVTFTGDPSSTAASIIRQIFLLNDSANRLSEIRVRYVDGPAADNKAAWRAELLAGLKNQNGVPTEAPSTWAGLWSNLPGRKQPLERYVWKDDTTALVYQRDRQGVEVTLRDDSGTSGPGEASSRLEFLPAGPENCLLGTERNALLQKWGVDKPTLTDDGALLLRPAAGSSYDALLVWFDKDRVVRVVAREAHDEEKGGPAQWSKALNAVWSREGASYGWPSRVDATARNEVQGLGWHDDQKQIYVFWQEASDGSARVFREWRYFNSR